MMSTVGVFAIALTAFISLYIRPALADDRIAVSIKDSGAVCDGMTDDTAKINAGLAGLTNGGLVFIPFGSQCLINSGNLNVPTSVLIRGSTSATSGMVQPNPSSSGFLLNPSYTINMAAGSALRDLNVIRTNLKANPSDVDAISAVQRWGAENSNAVTITAGGVRLEHLFIEGFNTAIYDYGWGDFIFSDVIGDDYNGIFVTAAGDNMAIIDTRFEPFYSINSSNATVGQVLSTSAAQPSPGNTLQFVSGSLSKVQVGDYVNILSGPSAGSIPLGATVTTVNNNTGILTLSVATTSTVTSGQPVTIGGAWARPGTSFYIQGQAGNTTGWYCVRCFSFMYRGGVSLDGVGIGYLEQGGFEWQNSYDPASNGSGVIGVRMLANSTSVVISDTYSGGHSIEFSDELVARPVELHNLAIGSPDSLTNGLTGPNGIAGLFLEGGNEASYPTEAIGGTATPGSTASVTINGTTVTYTLSGNDNFLTVGSGLARLINSNATLAAAHIASSWMSIGANQSGIMISGPAAVALSVSASGSSGGITFTSGSTTNVVSGSWGQLTGYTFAGGTVVPSIMVGPAAILPFKLSGFPVSNTGGLQGLISIDPTSVGAIQLQNLPSAPGATLSNCGSGASLSTNATDARGTITEGATATGCALTFRTQWPLTPVCTVTSPNGAPLSTYSTSTTALTIANPSRSGSQFTYSCQE